MSKKNIQVFEDLTALSEHATQLFIEIAGQAIRDRGRLLVALSGGSTPVKLFEQLAHEKLDWGHIHFFWGDERCVPTDNAENSYGQAKKIFLDKAKVPTQNIHRVLADLEPAEAARDYANTLKAFSEPPLEWPRFDLVLLGMGDDGHTASLFPGSPVEVDAPTLAVTAKYQGRPANRVTMTQKVFNDARNIVFLVSGASKAVTLSRVLSDVYMPAELPAQRIAPEHGQLIWLVDKAAYAAIQGESV